MKTWAHSTATRRRRCATRAVSWSAACAPRSTSSRVTDAVRALVDVSALLALGDRAGLDAALARAAAVAADDAIEEALLQSYLFLGYPAALYGLSVWRKRKPPPPPSPAGDGDLREWQARGDATCARVYGEQYARLRDNVAALHPDIERWMIVEGYGK